MKYAVISVSKEGAQLGAKVRRALGGNGTLYERYGSESGEDAIYFNRTVALTADIFSQYDRILYIMATGIVIRAIAPHVVSKASDPAIVCMDECGMHCISLLSGHLGGANQWTRVIAEAIGADPVITTATDVHKRHAPDDVARELMMRVEPLGALKPVNSVIAAGGACPWFLDKTTDGAEEIEKILRAKEISVEDAENISKGNYEACVIISERNIRSKKPFVWLRPKNVYVGIGCKRGTAEELIKDAFYRALETAGIHIYQVASLASVDLKADEKGLLDFAQHMNVPIHFYKSEELKRISEVEPMEISAFVEKTIGVGNVCQTAALKESKQGKIVLAKTRYKSVTVAIAKGLSV